MRAKQRDLTFYSSLVRVCRCVDRYRKLASSFRSFLLLFLVSFFTSHFFSLSVVVRSVSARSFKGAFVLWERSNIILTDAVHDMEKRSANEKTSYGWVSSFFYCVSRLVFRFVATYGAKCCSITSETPGLIPTPSSSNRDSMEEFVV